MKILFVCLGNICRSPTAEAVFRQRAQAAELSVHIESAGTGAWHAGEPPDSRAQAAGRSRGYRFDGQSARKVSRADFKTFDYILAMDQRNLRDLRAACPKGEPSNLKLFMDFSPERSEREVPDPYYGGEDGFEHVIDLIEAASDGLIASLKK